MRDQLVAVKVFKVDAPPEQAEQIAEALQAVVQALPRHRGLVELHAAGVERDTAYLVMAHSDVPSLDSRLKPGAGGDSSTPPVDAEQALVIVRTLAEAMDAAHARGIVHGGLHPRDIFVDDRGVCRAAGFGVATALERAGVKVPVRRPYSPPERLTSALIEPPADRFALGAIAFELLTGRRIAGTGSNAAARYNASVPGADLDAVRNALAAMLAEQPAHRPSTATAFAQALALALFPQGVARASVAAAATGANRSPAAAARDDRRNPQSAPGIGSGDAGAAAGAIAAGASNLSRHGDGDPPSPDDLELFTREGLLTGQPRQPALRWEHVDTENVIAPGEDPLELFAPESEAEAEAKAAAEAASAAANAAGLDTGPDDVGQVHGAVAAADARDGVKPGPKAGGQGDEEADAEAAADAAEAFTATEASELPTSLPDSILGLSTIVAPRERDAATPAQSPDASASAAMPAPRDDRGHRDDRDDDDDDDHETTALPFVPIKADARLSPSAPHASRLRDSGLIDDHSRIDVLDRMEHLEHLDRIDHGGRLVPGERNDDIEHLDDLDRFERTGDVDDADDAGEPPFMTPAAAAAAGVVAAGGVPSGAADLSASHSAHHAYSSHGSHASHASQASRAADEDEPEPDTSHLSSARGGRAYGDRTQSAFDREAREAETWVAPAAAPTAHPPSMLTNPPETSDVRSSIRIVVLVLALGLAVGGAGGYLLGQRSALRNGSLSDLTSRGGDDAAARPAAGGDQADGASAGAGAAPAAPAAPGASDRAAAGATGASGSAASGGSGAAGAAGKPGDSGNRSAAAANAPSGRPGAAGVAGGAAPSAGSSAAIAPTGASSPAGGSRPAAAATGRLTINSNPARADVAIDGVRRGVTPLTLRDLPFGSHTVRVTRGGYAPETRRVNVVAGRPAESITLDLEPTAPRTRPSTAGGPAAGAAPGAAASAPERGSASGLGSLYIVSRPMGARVTVDGRLVGATPLLLTDVSSGSHTIALQADGHKPWQTTVQVKMGERTRVAGSLEEGR